MSLPINVYHQRMIETIHIATAKDSLSTQLPGPNVTMIHPHLDGFATNFHFLHHNRHDTADPYISCGNHSVEGAKLYQGLAQRMRWALLQECCDLYKTTGWLNVATTY